MALLPKGVLIMILADGPTGRLILQQLLDLAVYGVVGLVAIWVLVSRRRWVLGVAVLSAIIPLALVISHYNSMTFFQRLLALICLNQPPLPGGKTPIVFSLVGSSQAGWILLGVLTVATCSLVGLVAIWGALATCHWLLRTTVVGAMIAVALAIPAYDLALVFFIQCVVAVVPLVLVRSCASHAITFSRDAESDNPPTVPTRLQFSLRDLLLGVFVFSCIVAAAVTVPTEAWHYWREFTLFGFSFGVFTLVAAWAVLGRRALWLRLFLVWLLPLSAVMAGWLALLRASECPTGHEAESGSVARASHRSGRSQSRSVRVARAALVLLSLLVLLPPGTAYYYVAFSPAVVTEPPAPSPNGYDDLIRATQRLNVGVRRPYTYNRAEMRAFVRQNEDVLHTARAGLNRQCRLTPEHLKSGDPGCRADLMYGLVHLFAAEGKLAEMEDRTVDAARSYRDLMRLGHAVATGGLTWHWVVGRSAEAGAAHGLHRLRCTLTPTQCRELIHTLQQLNATREPLEDSEARYWYWGFYPFGWRGRIVSMDLRISRQTLHTIKNNYEDRPRYEAQIRLLICDLALQCYRVEQNSYPRQLAELVPDYLASVPQDPFGPDSLVYRRTPTGYLLYSVGYDKRDDAGRALDGSLFKGDKGDITLKDDPPWKSPQTTQSKDSEPRVEE